MGGGKHHRDSAGKAGNVVGKVEATDSETREDTEENQELPETKMNSPSPSN